MIRRSRMKVQHAEDNDDQLAPMVDGLSGALCLLILVTTIFMVSATDTFVNHMKGYKFNFSDSIYRKEENKIYFNSGINLSHQDLFSIRESIEKLSDPRIYIYIPESVKGWKEKILFNFMTMKENLNLKKPLKFSVGSKSECGSGKSCVYWKE